MFRFVHTQALTSSQLVTQTSRGFKNFFKKSESDQRPSKKRSDSFIDKISQSIKESFIVLQDESQRERRFALKEARRKEELAQAFFNLGQYQKALEKFKGTLYIMKENCQEDDPRLAHFLHKIGDVYFEVKEWDQAINNYEEGLEILVSRFGDQDEEVARSHFLIGMCYVKQKKYAMAIENLRKSLNTYESCFGKHQQTIASCYTMLAESSLQLGKYAEVLKYTEKLLDLLREMNKGSEEMKEEDDPLMTQYYVNLGVGLAHANKDYQLAEQYLKIYLKNQVKMNVHKGSGVGMYYLRMGEIKVMQGKYEEAMENYQKCVEIMKKSAGVQCKILGAAYNGMGVVYLELNDNSKAIENFEEGVKQLENCENTSLDRANCFRNLGIAMLKQGENEKAIENFKKGSEERAELFGEFSKGELELATLYMMMCIKESQDLLVSKSN